MTVATVTKADVAAALEEFRHQGKRRPGLHRIREVIGHGSLARIKRLIQEIDLETIDRLAPELIKKVPDPVSVAAAKLWAEIEAASDKLQLSIEENLAKAQAVMHDEVEGLRRQLTDTKKSLQAAEQARATAEKTLAANEAERARFKAELAASIESEKRLRGEIATQASAGAEREAILNDRVDKERQRSTDEAHAARQREEHLKGQLESTQAALAKARESHAAYGAGAEATARALKEQIKERDNRLKALEQQMDALLAKRDTEMKRLEDERNEQAARQLELEKLVTRSEARQDALADELKHVRQDLAGAQKLVEAIQNHPKKSAPAKRVASKPRKTK